MDNFNSVTLNPARSIESILDRVDALERAYNEERGWEEDEALIQYQGLSFDRGSIFTV